MNEFYARKYRPIREYGGWGIRYGWNGRAYSTSGNEGVQLVGVLDHQTVTVVAPDLSSGAERGGWHIRGIAFLMDTLYLCMRQ